MASSWNGSRPPTLPKPRAHVDWEVWPHDLDDNPELAILAALYRTLDLALYALHAVHPALVDDLPINPPYYDDYELRAAHAILRSTRRLQHALANYRMATSEPPNVPGDDNNF